MRERRRVSRREFLTTAAAIAAYAATAGVPLSDRGPVTDTPKPVNPDSVKAAAVAENSQVAQVSPVRPFAVSSYPLVEATPTATPTETPPATTTSTPTASETPTARPTNTLTSTPTETATLTPTETHTPTPTESPTSTGEIVTSSETPTLEATPSDDVPVVNQTLVSETAPIPTSAPSVDSSSPLERAAADDLLTPTQLPTEVEAAPQPAVVQVLETPTPTPDEIVAPPDILQPPADIPATETQVPTELPTETLIEASTPTPFETIALTDIPTPVPTDTPTLTPTPADTPTPLPTSTLTPTSTQTHTPTPEDTATPIPTATAAIPDESENIATDPVLEEAPAEVADTPEDSKREIFREVIIPKIQEKTLKRRAERAAKDKEYLDRINPELNKERINGVLFGIGSEGSLADSILVWSYDVRSHTLSLISFPRDLQSPEVLKITNNDESSRINQTISIGGLDLGKVAIENATGLSMDYAGTGRFEALAEIIDELGGVDVTVDRELNDPKYPAKVGYGYEPLLIPAGPQHMDGETGLKYARSRYSTSDYDRAKRQRQLGEAIIEKSVQEVREAGITGAWDRADDIFSIFQRQVDKENLTLDFDLKEYRPTAFNIAQNVAITALPGVIWNQVFGTGWRFVSKPKTRQLGINPGERIRKRDPQTHKPIKDEKGQDETLGPLVVDAPTRLSITKIDGGNPRARNPRTGYWQEVRYIVEDFLTPEDN